MSFFFQVLGLRFGYSFWRISFSLCYFVFRLFWQRQVRWQRILVKQFEGKVFVEIFQEAAFQSRGFKFDVVIFGRFRRSVSGRGIASVQVFRQYELGFLEGLGGGIVTVQGYGVGVGFVFNILEVFVEYGRWVQFYLYLERFFWLFFRENEVQGVIREVGDGAS